MKISVVKTPTIYPFDNLYYILKSSLPPLKEGSILVITSKIVSLCEGAVVDINSISKDQLIKQEADAHLFIEKYGIYLTKKWGLLIPSAGIDESNVEGYFVLYPRDLLTSVNAIGDWLRSFYQLESCGVIISDSHTTPLRRGTMGLGLCWNGFSPLYNYIGKPDCFGHPLRMTYSNLLDGLSAAAVLCMGEGAEHTPLAIIEDAPKVVFHSSPTTLEDMNLLGIAQDEDLYGPLLQSMEWKTH
ncbi:F420-0--gamma-glutamyl ligase,putative folate metabolism gamma-glutamate ligase,F420-0:Gamma-glutamyl ligase [Chlamydia serpentis]|uniref:F420-0--gamma-glutamyl ligase,putative folate metabolism gamma-glutamate ligase,F420-0:Gamma-glutamyl ligase n=1 Tax=Chlamydia serpentis TaxID=1967782 RepID=A0A2R8FBR3_9CHLA|nr:putative folate metabolism gamma-glutamate ligase [Chlamydia serpentis]SPN73875.1 F420-0--gamma-glutamyl ligase,putative folate metabolism gamma-glutamate ligase,F420-0:Gamma-glutamyl ligase [Chlamydia serpentis]